MGPRVCSVGLIWYMLLYSWYVLGARLKVSKGYSFGFWMRTVLIEDPSLRETASL